MWGGASIPTATHPPTNSFAGPSAAALEHEHDEEELAAHRSATAEKRHKAELEERKQRQLDSARANPDCWQQMNLGVVYWTNVVTREGELGGLRSQPHPRA